MRRSSSQQQKPLFQRTVEAILIPFELLFKALGFTIFNMPTAILTGVAFVLGGAWGSLGAQNRQSFREDYNYDGWSQSLSNAGAQAWNAVADAMPGANDILDSLGRYAPNKEDVVDTASSGAQYFGIGLALTLGGAATVGLIHVGDNLLKKARLKK